MAHLSNMNCFVKTFHVTWEINVIVVVSIFTVSKLKQVIVTVGVQKFESAEEIRCVFDDNSSEAILMSTHSIGFLKK